MGINKIPTWQARFTDDEQSGRDVVSQIEYMQAEIADLHAELAKPDARDGVLTWESTTSAYTKFITDAKYQALSDKAKKWYRPACLKCAGEVARDTKRLLHVYNRAMQPFIRPVQTFEEWLAGLDKAIKSSQPSTAPADDLYSRMQQDCGDPNCDHCAPDGEGTQP